MVIYVHLHVETDQEDWERKVDLCAAHFDENNVKGMHIQHGVNGVPGAFFNFEISPILIVHSETQQSFAHFLTSYVSPTSIYFEGKILNGTISIGHARL